ncbi:MAG: CvpA family protein [Muribaculum sp.]|nr:CvpA family protein [Muribaculum sp.]
MSAIDIAILAVVGASLVYGLCKGIISQLASLGGVVLGIIACRLFAKDMGPLVIQTFPNTFSSETSAAIAGTVILFLLVFFTVGAFASLARKLTHTLLLGWLDHLLGGLFCVFKWLLVMSILLNVWYLVSPGSGIFTSSHLMDGRLLPWIIRLAPDLLGVVTDQFKDMVSTL